MKKQIMVAFLFLASFAHNIWGAKAETKFIEALKNHEFDKAHNILNETSLDINAIEIPDSKDLKRNLLDYALEQKDQEIFEFLLKNKIDKNKKDSAGLPVYTWCIMRGDKMDILPYLESLYKYGADINQTDDQGETALHTAVRARLPKVVKFFLQHGANINTKRTDGKSPLDSAEQRKNKEIIQLLKNVDKTTEVKENKDLEKENKELKKLAESIQYHLDRNEINNELIFEFKPFEDQLKFSALTDRKTLETIGKYQDTEGNIHYFIQYHNPFAKKLPNRMIEIDKKEYDKKKQVIDELFNNREEQARFIKILDSSHPETIYTKSTDIYIKQENVYRTFTGGTNYINNPSYWACKLDWEKSNSNEFEKIKQQYEKQQKLLRKIYEKAQKE